MLQPDSTVASGLPVDASLMIYVPRSEHEEAIMMYYGQGNKHLHRPGKDMKDAALSVADNYFTAVDTLSVNETAHYVLKLEGDASLDHVWGVYSVKMHGTLFRVDGEVLYEAIVTSSTSSGFVNDENAFFNTYVNAAKRFFDDLFATTVNEISLYAASASSARFVPGNLGISGKLDVIASGTGFFINGKGQLVTNRHVISECLAISVSVNGEETQASVVHSDDDKDIAVLATDLKNDSYAYIHAYKSRVRLGEEIVTVGYPLHGVLSSNPSLTTGNISALSGFDNNEHVLQISAPIQQGNSGGPLLNRQGHVVGVVQSKLNALQLAQITGDIAQNVNFAIHAESLTSVLDDGGIAYNVANDRSEQNLSTPDIADSAVSYTVQVMCRG